LYQWKEYSHNPIAHKRREKEDCQNTRASWKTIKENNDVAKVTTILNM
jgi:hypothetical protein